ncbi:D-erythronate dehydrogenase [Arthrobacter sp. QXT-31]|uniref:D-erythronate dehydrogenase n=1 Tax=Arthrobacter sp. QXT-31 TaxID=1357915 RepID=UPI001C12BE4E|nr:D-erythronate dehydrogenase [Arthrobacter sp. QXT-31]
MDNDCPAPGLRVLITGGAGFLGTALARRLLEAEAVLVGGSDAGPVRELTLLDLFPPAQDLAVDERVRTITGELAEVIDQLGPVDCIFHLAGVVSGAAELDFDLGMTTNVDGTRVLLEFARRLPGAPVLVFASSLAVFGSDPAVGSVGMVDDDTLPRPQSSYGIQKFIGEQLVADYTRKGFLRGRSVRLMTVSVRPGAPNAAASSFMSGIIREPLAGLPAVCPVPPDTELALSSPERTIEGILRAAAVDDAAWGSRTAVNLPALTTTPREMIEALDRVSGHELSALIDWTADPDVTAIVGSWPARFTTTRANGLGLEADSSFDDIIRAFMQSSLPATVS